MNDLIFTRDIDRRELEFSKLNRLAVVKRHADDVLGRMLMGVLRDSKFPVVCKLEVDQYSVFGGRAHRVDTIVRLQQASTMKIVVSDEMEPERVIVPRDVVHTVYRSPPSLWSRLRGSVAESWKEARKFSAVGCTRPVGA